MPEKDTAQKRSKAPKQPDIPTQPTTEERIIQLPLSELHPFKDHPFKVRDDDTMAETTQSVKDYGVLIPAMNLIPLRTKICCVLLLLITKSLCLTAHCHKIDRDQQKHLLRS